jgi:hypothetical protein
VIARGLRIVSVGSVLVLLASFGLFAIDQARGFSRSEQRRLAGEDPALPTTEHHPQPRRAIDGTARVLLTPFSALGSGDGAWGQRTLPTLAALLVFGLGLGLLAGAARGLP